MSHELKASQGGRDVADARRPKALAGGNGRLKRLLADVIRDNGVLKDLPGSKPWDATGPRDMAED